MEAENRVKKFSALKQEASFIVNLSHTLDSNFSPEIFQKNFPLIL